MIYDNIAPGPQKSAPPNPGTFFLPWQCGKITKFWPVNLAAKSI